MTDRVVSEELEGYALEHTTAPSPEVSALRAETEQSMPVPAMAGGQAEVRLLEALVVVSGAKRVLEIGTFTGVTALSLAACLPPGGRLITLEADEGHAAVARRHFDSSPYRDRIELVLGDARDTLSRLEGEFDLVWIDAWKRDYPTYYRKVLPKLAARGVIAADNVLLDGRVLDETAVDEDAAGMRAFADLVQEDPRVHNVLLTIGDGVLLAWKVPE